jgi:hypothetical protein
MARLSPVSLMVSSDGNIWITFRLSRVYPAGQKFRIIGDSEVVQMVVQSGSVPESACAGWMGGPPDRAVQLCVVLVAAWQATQVRRTTGQPDGL